MKIVFVAPEEPSVMPIFFRKVIPALREEIAAIAVVSPICKKFSWATQAKLFIDSFGVRDFTAEALRYGCYKGADLIRSVMPIGSHHSVKRIARSAGLPLLTPENVNSPEFLQALRELEPDLVVSVSCPQIFGNELLQLPRLGCVNVHSALLPHYRGMLPTFWVLAKGEQRTGVTVHYMSPGIDGGDIILQRQVPIRSEETLRSLMRACKVAAADTILETVERFRDGSVLPSPNPPDEGSYFSFPSREDVALFRGRGRALR
jgi:methionyl-tRNA formyltransferase